MILLLDIGHSACKYLIGEAALIRQYFTHKNQSRFNFNFLEQLNSLGLIHMGSITHPHIQQKKSHHQNNLQLRQSFDQIYIAASSGKNLTNNLAYVQEIIEKNRAAGSCIQYLNHDAFKDFQINYSENIGVDRLLFAKAVSAINHIKTQQGESANRASILISHGSATTIDLIAQNAHQKYFLGGAILPNLLSAYDYLIENTKLPIIQSLERLDFLPQLSADFLENIAHNTETALQQGFVFQYLSQLKSFESLYLDVLKEKNYPYDILDIYLTGGAAAFFYPITQLQNRQKLSSSLILSTQTQNIYHQQNMVLFGLLLQSMMPIN